MPMAVCFGIKGSDGGSGWASQTRGPANDDDPPVKRVVLRKRGALCGILRPLRYDSLMGCPSGLG